MRASHISVSAWNFDIFQQAEREEHETDTLSVSKLYASQFLLTHGRPNKSLYNLLILSTISHKESTCGVHLLRLSYFLYVCEVIETFLHIINTVTKPDTTFLSRTNYR